MGSSDVRDIVVMLFSFMIVAGLAAILLAWMQPEEGQTPPMDRRDLRDILILLCATLIVGTLAAIMLIKR
jgi:hypothetical protein